MHSVNLKFRRQELETGDHHGGVCKRLDTGPPRPYFVGNLHLLRDKGGWKANEYLKEKHQLLLFLELVGKCFALPDKRIGVAVSQEFRSSFRFPTLILCGTHVEVKSFIIKKEKKTVDLLFRAEQTEREDQQGYLVVQFGTQTVKGGK